MSDMSVVSPSITGVFNVVCTSLGRESDKVAKVFSGTACEAWLLAEMRLAIDWAEPRLLAENQWATLESKKGDVIVIDQSASGDTARQARHVIEVKVLYSTYSGAKLRDKLRALRDQLSDRSAGEHNDTTQVSSVIFAAWDNANPRKKPRGYAEFLTEVQAAIGEVFTEAGFDRGPPALRSIVEPTWITSDGRRYQIAMSATWLSRAADDIHDFPVSAAEIAEVKRRLASDSKRYTTEQVLDHLRSLEK